MTVLVMVVILSVVLSVASRTISTIRTSKNEVASQQAFYAAEAGVERALLEQSGGGSPTTITDTNYNVKITPQGGTGNLKGILYRNGQIIPNGESVDVFLSNQDFLSGRFRGRVRIFWGDDSVPLGSCKHAAIQVVVLYGLSTDPKIMNFALDPCATRRADNKFMAPTLASRIPFEQTTTSGGRSYIQNQYFPYQFNVDVRDGLLMRVIPIYHGTPIGVNAVHLNDLSCQQIQQQISDLQESLANIRLLIDQLNAQIANIDARIANKRQEINQAHNQIANSRDRIDRLRRELNNTNCNQSPNRCDNLRQEIDQEQREIDRLQNRIDSLQRDINQLQNEKNNLIADRDELIQDRDEIIANINNLQSKLPDCDNPNTPAALPIQGFVIESTGKVGDTERSIKVFQSFPRVPDELFPYVIFSPLAEPFGS
jgi:cell division protein FtsB